MLRHDRIGRDSPALKLLGEACLPFCLCFQCGRLGSLVANSCGMILLIWSSDRVRECALSIQHALQESVEIAPSLHEGADRLRSSEYSAVVVDQWISDSEPEPTTVLFEHLGSAVPVFVNFGISGVERILRELRAALARRAREVVMARHAARRGLRNELKDDVTALLLSCGIALGDLEVSESARRRILQIQQIAEHMKAKLAAPEPENIPAGMQTTQPG